MIKYRNKIYTGKGSEFPSFRGRIIYASANKKLLQKITTLCDILDFAINEIEQDNFHLSDFVGAIVIIDPHFLEEKLWNQYLDIREKESLYGDITLFKLDEFDEEELLLNLKTELHNFRKDFVYYKTEGFEEKGYKIASRIYSQDKNICSFNYLGYENVEELRSFHIDFYYKNFALKLYQLGDENIKVYKEKLFFQDLNESHFKWLIDYNTKVIKFMELINPHPRSQ